MRPALAFFLALPACLLAQDRLTLEEAERIAIERHPRLRSLASQTAATRAQVQQVKGTMQPFLAGNVTSSIADHGSRIGAGGINASSIFTRLGSGIAVNQTLFDFGRTSKLAESVSTRAEAQDAIADQSRGQLRWEVRQAYVRVLSLQQLLSVARSTIASRELVRKQIAALVNSQLRSTLDLQFAEVALGEAEVLAARLEGDLTSAQASLATTLGFSDARTFVLEEIGSDYAWSDEVDALVQEAMRARPEVISRRRLAASAAQFAESERRLRLPSVAATGVFGFVPAGDPRLQSRYGGFGLNLNIPVFNGRTLDARRQEAVARADSATHDVGDAELRVTREVRTAHADAANARRQIGLAEKQLTQSRRLLAMARLRYENGLSTIVELNQAELALMSAEIAATNSRYLFVATCATLDLATGRLR